MAAINLESVGFVVVGSSISSRAMLALATRSFSERSVWVTEERDLSTYIRICLSDIIPLAIASACSGFMRFWTMVA